VGGSKVYKRTRAREALEEGRGANAMTESPCAYRLRPRFGLKKRTCVFRGEMGEACATSSGGEDDMKSGQGAPGS